MPLTHLTHLPTVKVSELTSHTHTDTDTDTDTHTHTHTHTLPRD